jgi:hypothetical protein
MRDRELLLQNFSRNSIICEIGVWRGDFSSKLLAYSSELHLIDPWIYTTKYGYRLYGGAYAKNQDDMDCIYEEVVEKFYLYNNVKIHRMKSSEAFALFHDSFFDVIYIDGNHYIDFITKDLEFYFPKVKKNGLLCGDDYYWNSPELEGFQPVKIAVDNFVRKYSLKLEIIGSQFLIKLIN